VAGGDLYPVSRLSPVPFAKALAALVDLAPAPDEVPSLEPQLPWIAPDFGSSVLWPAAANVDPDLSTTGGWTWIDEASSGTGTA